MHFPVILREFFNSVYPLVLCWRYIVLQHLSCSLQSSSKLAFGPLSLFRQGVIQFFSFLSSFLASSLPSSLPFCLFASLPSSLFLPSFLPSFFPFSCLPFFLLSLLSFFIRFFPSFSYSFLCSSTPSSLLLCSSSFSVFLCPFLS